MHRYNVDLYICAHKHYYERLAASFDRKATTNGTVQIVNGAAGNNEGVDKGKGVGKADLLLSANYKDHGYGELEVANGTMTWRYILSSNGKVFDELRF